MSFGILEIGFSKIMYQSMKEKVDTVVERGVIGDEYITSAFESQAFRKWITGFTRQDHPTVVQVLLEGSRDRDVMGHNLPNLVYVSREKNRTSAHHFKAGALNVLLRVSATMTNAPLVLTQDCDMYSNDPKTPLNALCFFLEPTNSRSEFAYVQFPQRFHGVNTDDIYASELKKPFRIDASGSDGLAGTYCGTGCFFCRRALFGCPLSQCLAEIPELNPDHVDKPIQSETIQEMSHSVPSCSYENGTNWGSKTGFRYGSLVEDYYTGFRLLCEGWKTVFCDPDRAAFLGDVPVNLHDSLSQLRRWVFGLLEVGFSKYSPITFGVRSMGLAMGLGFGLYAFWGICSIPITIYALVPPLALLNGVYLFPKSCFAGIKPLVLLIHVHIPCIIWTRLSQLHISWRDIQTMVQRSKNVDAKFAAHWLPFCRENNLLERCPQAYFNSNVHVGSETEKIKILYETMKEKVDTVVERGVVGDEYIMSESESQVFSKWTTGFTRQEHPTVIQILLESSRDRDVTGHSLPNLVYFSREKNRTATHHFKAGALNALLRVSATMTNAPLVLTQDCDMYSNDPNTPLNALCFLLDPTNAMSDLAYIQFPQRFHGINADDIYGSELKGLFRTNPPGMDGLAGPNYVGSGCFFRRRAFFGGPSSQIFAEIPELNSDHVVDKPIQSEMVQDMAHNVSSCSYESGTSWGSKMGFRYGSLVEDYYTGFRMLCEGWKAVFCDPERAAFLGDVPISLNDSLSQTRRWAYGLLEVGFSKYSPITFGVRSMGLAMGMCFAYYSFWPIWFIPITVYGLVPSLALLNGVYLFPKATSPWYYLYMFVFLGSYGHDLLDFISTNRTFKQWYNDQRIWMIRGLSSHPFGLFDYICKLLGISAFGFNVTSKAVDGEQSKRYKQGLFEFGIASPLFVPLATTTIINLFAFVVGIAETIRQGNLDEKFLQLGLSGFVVMNSWPIYEAMVLRVDGGRMPWRITLISVFLACLLCSLAFLILGN